MRLAVGGPAVADRALRNDKAAVVLGDSYPHRIVVHEEQRPKALALYGARLRT